MWKNQKIAANFFCVCLIGACCILGISLPVWAAEETVTTMGDASNFGEDFLQEDFWGPNEASENGQEHITLSYYEFSKPFQQDRQWTARIANESTEQKAISVTQTDLGDGTKIEMIFSGIGLSGGDHRVVLYETGQLVAETYVTVQNRYYIRYVANAEDAVGVLLDTICYYGQEQRITADTFYRAGYLFTGWNTKANGTGKRYEPEQGISNLTTKGDGVISLYAQWKALSYHVIFSAGKEANGTPLQWSLDYTGNMKDFLLKYGVNKTLPSNTFKRTGYTFAGWEDQAGNLYGNRQQIANLVTGMEEELTLDENGIPQVELTAKWIPAVYKVTYRFASAKSPGGVSMPKITDTKYTRYDTEQGLRELPELSGLAVPGYDFCWYRDSKYTQRIMEQEIPIEGNRNGQMNTGNRTFYGRWEKKVIDESEWTGREYTIRFDANRPAGCPAEYQITGVEKMVEQTCVFGKKKTLPSNSMKLTGYTFAGWTTVPDGTTPIYKNRAGINGLVNADGTEIITELTLYAVWKPVKYQIHYKNAIQGRSGVTQNDNPAQYTVETNTIALSVPVRPGYTFAGWYRDSKYQNSLPEFANQGKMGYYLSTEEAKTITIYAKWKPKEISIIFAPNVPVGAELVKNSDKKMVPKTYLSGKGTSILANTYQIKNKTFLGWSTEPVLSTTEADFVYFPDKAKITDLTERFDGQQITLYAIWGPTTYQIQYVPNATSGVTGSMKVQTGSIKKKIRLLSNRYQRKGYQFVGWNTKADGTGILYQNNASVKAIGNGKEKITLYAIWKLVEE